MRTQTVGFRRLGAALVGVSAIAALAACSSTKKAASSTAGGTGSSAEAGQCAAAAAKYMQAYAQPPTTLGSEFTPLSKAPEAGGTVVKIYNAEIPKDVAGFEATKQAVAAVGWKVVGISFNGTLPDFTDKFNQAISEKPDAIMTAGQEPTSIPGPMAEAKKAGILVQMNSTVAEPTSVPGFGAEVLGVQAQQLNGEIAAEWAMADSGCKAHVLVVNLAGFPILKATTDNLQSVLKQSCADCTTTYAEIQSKELGTAQATGSIVGALQSDPSLKYVFLNNGGLAKGLTTAITQANITGLKIFGSGPDAAAIASLQNKTNAMWTGQSSVVLAWAAFDSVLRALDAGKPVIEKQVPGTSVYTPDNVAGITATPDYPTNYQALFKQIWNPNS